MSARIAILGPDPADESFSSRWREVLDRAAAPLRDAGLIVESRSWTEAEDLAGFDLVMPLLVWGYPRAHPQWIEAVSRWEEEGVSLMNPASVLRWNADKKYLEMLAGRGAATVPTLFVDKADQAAMEQAARRFGAERLVAKPRISSSAWQTIRWSPGEDVAGGPESAAMIQPYLPEIERAGEISLIYFGGAFSHAISKVPQPSDFRVQPEYDGVITAYSPKPDELEAAEGILAAAGEDLLYARIDLVRDLEGKPVLIELELIEPDLYLGHDPGKGAAFADAVRAYLGG